MTCLSGMLWTQIDCHTWNSLLKHVNLSAGGSDLPGPIVLFCVAKYENFTAASVRKSLFSPHCLLLSTAWLPWTYLSTAPPSQFISLPRIFSPSSFPLMANYFHQKQNLSDFLLARGSSSVAVGTSPCTGPLVDWEVWAEIPSITCACW